MRKNKTKVKPYISGYADKSNYDFSYGASVSKGPLSLSINQSRGVGYTPETDVNLSLSIPITQRAKGNRKKL